LSCDTLYFVVLIYIYKKMSTQVKNAGLTIEIGDSLLSVRKVHFTIDYTSTG